MMDHEHASGDEVYIVNLGWGIPLVAFGHLRDANAYVRTFGVGTVSPAKVLDHAEARTLIEGEG